AWARGRQRERERFGFEEEETAHQRFAGAEPERQTRARAGCQRVLKGEVAWLAEEMEETRQKHARDRRQHTRRGLGFWGGGRDVGHGARGVCARGRVGRIGSVWR